MMSRRFFSWIRTTTGPSFQLNDDDIVVFVVGPSGSGKSLFVREVTKSDILKVGENLRPSTVKVQAIRCELGESAKIALGASMRKSIVFIDTPSFCTHNNAREEEAEKEMRIWLSKLRCKSTLIGTIYMHRAETDPAHERIQLHLDSFAYAFPQGFNPLPERLHVVLSYEGMVHKDKVMHRRSALQAQLNTLRPSWTRAGRFRWQTSFHPNLFRQGASETAWEAVIALFSHTQSW